MKFENFYYFALGILSIVKCSRGKSVTATDKTIELEFENYLNCTQLHSSKECLERTGRKRKGDSGGAGNNVVVVGGGGGGHAPVGHDHSLGFVEVYEDDDDNYSNKKGRKGKKRKKNKGSKKIYKHIRPIMYGVAGLKLIMDHFLLKKLAFFSFFSFMLSKIAFILSTLVALKQFFHNSGGHSRAESNKLEVIHIPIKKFTKKSPYDADWDESKIIPITYSSDSLKSDKPTTSSPYFTYPSHESFISSEELLGDEFVPKVSGAGEYNFDNDGNVFDRSDKIEVNHVHSPFV